MSDTTNHATLPNDVSRCEDSKCWIRETCQRWTDRETQGNGEGGFWVHGSLWQPEPSDPNECRNRIPTTEGET